MWSKLTMNKVVLIIILFGFSCSTTEGIIPCNSKPKFPRHLHQVLVRNRKNFHEFCSGSILNHKHILTSGSGLIKAGIDKPHKGEVVAGTSERVNWTPQQQTRSIMTIHNHRGFKYWTDKNLYSHDMAILEIYSLNMSDRNVDAVNIGHTLKRNDTFKIGGWGRYNYNNEVSDTVLLVEMKYSISTCMTFFHIKYEYIECGYCIWGNYIHGPYRRDEGAALVSDSDGKAYGMFARKRGYNAWSIFIDLTKYTAWIESFKPTPSTTTTTVRPMQELIPASSRGIIIRDYIIPVYSVAYLFVVLLQ